MPQAHSLANLLTRSRFTFQFMTPAKANFINTLNRNSKNVFNQSEGGIYLKHVLFKSHKQSINQEKRKGSNEKREGKDRGMKTYLMAIPFYV